MSTVTQSESPEKLSRKDFVTPNDVRWCPGCGDYAILNCLQRTFPELGIPRENFVVISGIGCSSRFPYYMNTYGFHTIHGRAPTVAQGVKLANPDLSVWMITGDGDGLSIGGNHLLHVLRRNPDINILLFNNRIYGLTKGQYSPTSPVGTRTKTTPMGSLEQPVNPVRFALSAEATFVARTMDNNVKHMTEVFSAAAAHKGVSFIEIFQNCVIFNDGAFDPVYARENRDDQMLFLEHGKPLLFGKDKKKGIRLNGLQPEVVTVGENGVTEKDILVHDAYCKNTNYATLLAHMEHPDFPTPVGVFRACEDKPIWESLVRQQVEAAKAKANGKADLQDLLTGEDFWEVQ